MGEQRDTPSKENGLTRDFTLEKYEELCRALISSGYTIITVREYFEDPENHDRQIAIVKHDVDRKINNALRMARLEQALGIRSTYYFRYPSTFRPEIIATIRDMGHEIGYHYETLSKTKGDPGKAIALFKDELGSLRAVADIRTICMHGSPLSSFNNQDLWKTYDFREFDIIGDAFLSVRDVRYFSDTGRDWSGKNSLRDVKPDAIVVPDRSPVETTDDLIACIHQDKGSLLLTVHPERWALDNGEWVLGVLKDHIMNTGKKVIRVIRG